MTTPEKTTIEELRREFFVKQEDYIGPMFDMAETATVYRGDVTTDATSLLSLADEQGDQGSLIVIDGNLTCTAQSIGWGCRDDFSNDVFLVTGDLRVNNIELSEIGYVIVNGSIYAKNIMGSYGDDGGSLHAEKDIHAEVIISTTYFMLGASGDIHAKHIIGDGTYATDFADEDQVISTEDVELFVDSVIEDDEANEELLYQHLIEGKPIFVNDGKPHNRPQ